MELIVRPAADTAALRVHGPAPATYYAWYCIREQMVFQRRETVLALTTLDTKI
jgi:hypothetical protein